MKRTETEVAAEIASLQACKAYVPHYSAFGDDNHDNIDHQIRYLSGELDINDDLSWDDLLESCQAAVLEAQAWRDGDSDEPPSAGWAHLKPA
jgi:hypothetical protein